jgi:MoaA/NifB/PqqE/SkfB family radical SAM enzyme
MSKNFCAAPWSVVSINPDGNAKVCPVSANQVKFVNLDELKTNPLFTEIRQSVIADTQHNNCSACWEREKDLDNEWISRRSIYQSGDFYNDVSNDSTFQLEYLDLRWSNTCNLNCVYCGPYFSSKWAELLQQKKSLRVLPELSIDQLKNLKVAHLAGGEPLLIKENYNLLSNLAEVNPDVYIEVTTNLTMINNNKIYELLKQFKNVTIVVSFESTGKKFEYIRNGAIWEDFLNNLKTVTTDFANVQINMVYFSLSSTDITNAIDVALQYVGPENVFITNESGNTAVDVISASALQYIQDINKRYAEELPEVLKNRLLQVIAQNTDCGDTSSFPKYIEFDRLTNQSHQLIFPELYI